MRTEEMAEELNRRNREEHERRYGYPPRQGPKKSPDTDEQPHMRLYRSMDGHQIKGAGISGFSLMVTLHSSTNPYIKYPAKGVLVILEQGTLLDISNAVFHHLKEDNTLGPPCATRNPVFTYGDRNEG